MKTTGIITPHTSNLQELPPKTFRSTLQSVAYMEHKRLLRITQCVGAFKSQHHRIILLIIYKKKRQVEDCTVTVQNHIHTVYAL